MTFTDSQRRFLSWTALGLAVLLLLWLLAPVLTPFVLAAVMAYALHPAVERLVRARVPRVLAVCLVVTATLLVLLAVLLLVVPILAKELPLLREQIPLLADRLNAHLSPWLAQYGIDVQLDTANIKAFVFKYMDANLEEWIAHALSSARIGGSALLALVGNAVLVPAVLFYVLLDWPNLVRRAHSLIPPRQRPGAEDFLNECDAVLGQYLRGQLLVMLSLAAFYSIGLALFGFDLALPVGVLTGLLGFIPYLGFGLGLVLAILAGVLQFASWYGLIAVAVVYGIGQVVESFVLTPRLVGERIGLNPLTVIFALLAFGHLFGFVGVMVALPVCAVLSVLARRLHAAYVSSSLYLD